MNMRIAVALIAAVAALPAAAQEAPTTPFSVRASAVYLPTSSAGDVTDRWGLGLGLGYDIQWRGLMPGKPSRTTLELDVADNSGKGGGVTLAAMGLVERIALKGEAFGAGTPYVGVGVGVAYLRTKRLEQGLIPAFASAGRDTGYEYQTVKSNGWRPNVRAILGVNLSEKAFVEAFYSYVGSVGGISGDSAGVTLGLRF